jgi:hypothetical protein
MSTIENPGAAASMHDKSEHYKISSKNKVKNNAVKVKNNAAFTKVLNAEKTKTDNKLKNISATNKPFLANKTDKSVDNSQYIDVPDKIDGMELARMKNVSKQLTDQFYGFLMTLMAEEAGKNPEGGVGEELFRKSLWPELVKNSTGGELDEIGNAVLRDLIRQEHYDGRQQKKTP